MSAGTWIFILVICWLFAAAPEIFVGILLIGIFALMYVGLVLASILDFILNIFRGERSWELTEKVWSGIKETDESFAKAVKKKR